MLNAVFLRDLRLSFRHGGGAWAGIGFYLTAFVLFAFALGPEGIAEYAPGVLTACMALGSTLSLPFLYERDAEDGTLEQYRLNAPGEWLALTKLCAYWCAQLLPLLALTPILLRMEGVDADSYLLKLILASVAIAAFSALGAALSLQAARGAFMRVLLLFPFHLPALIFAVSPQTEGAATALLAAWALLSVPVSCAVCAALLGD